LTLKVIADYNTHVDDLNTGSHSTMLSNKIIICRY